MKQLIYLGLKALQSIFLMTTDTKTIYILTSWVKALLVFIVHYALETVNYQLLNH